MTSEHKRRAAQDDAVGEVIDSQNAFTGRMACSATNSCRFEARRFDVLRDPSRQCEAIPSLVVLQSARFERAATRFVAPLILVGLAGVREHYLAPRFMIERVEVVMDVFDLATLPVERLGQRIGALEDEEARARLIRAFDELVSRA